jgi:hypothetical protein
VSGANSLLYVQNLYNLEITGNAFQANVVYNALACLINLRTAVEGYYRLGSNSFEGNTASKVSATTCYSVLDSSLYCPTLLLFVGQRFSGLIMTATNFTGNNLSPRGALLRVYNGPAEYTDNVFSDNAAGTYFVVTSRSTATFERCVFEGNSLSNSITIDYYSTVWW